MPDMTILPIGKTYPAAEGASILQAMLAAGMPAPGKCGGVAKCGGCHIFVIDGRKGLSKPQRLENERLDSLVGVGSKSRLACQVIVGSGEFHDRTAELCMTSQAVDGQLLNVIHSGLVNGRLDSVPRSRRTRPRRGTVNGPSGSARTRRQTHGEGQRAAQDPP